MARVEFAPEVVDDFDRILAYLVEHHVPDAAAKVDEIVRAIDVLVHSPLLGRLVGNDKRELVIGRKRHGFVALYRYVEQADMVHVLAVRSQRQAGYVRP